VLQREADAGGADEAGFDRLAEADVVGDEEIHAGEQQGLPQRFELVGIEPDAGPEGGLEQLGIGGGDAVPAERVQIRGEQPRLIKPAFGDRVPGFAGEDFRIEFAFPQHFQRLPLVVVIDARQPHQRIVTGSLRRAGVFNEVQPLAHAGNLPGDW
jgi:hypothetical protein